MTINQYVSKHLNRGEKIIPHIICADGFHMSVQVGAYCYCEAMPDGTHAFQSMEVGYPSQAEPLLIKYAEDKYRPTETVYPYVPVDVIDAVIAKHGEMAGWFKRILTMATILRDAFERNDTDLLAEAFRITVRQTKANIADRVNARYWEEG